MLLALLLAALASSAILTLANWRVGVPLAITLGMIQDPIRKMTPGAPPLLVLTSFPIWALVWAGVFVREGGWARFRRADPRLARAFQFFLLSLVPGTLVTLSYGLAAAPVAILGLSAYTSPLLTMVAGLAFSRRPRDVTRLLSYYAIFCALFLGSTLVEYLNLAPGWAAVGTEAMGFEWLRYSSTGALRMISGFFRSPDIAAWHAASLVMIGLTLSVFRRGPRMRWWLLLAAWGGACLIVTARRKGIVMPFVWLAFMGAVFLRSQRLTTLIRLALVVSVASAAFYWASGEFGVSERYYADATTVVSDAPGRLLEGSWGAVWQTFAQTGALGGGIGSATQGGQHLSAHVGETWQESGPGKLMVEIGLPGMLGAAALAFALARSAVRAARKTSLNSVPLFFGLLAFCAANAASFMVSHQIYSDPAVLNTTAFVLGLALAAPMWGGSISTSVPQSATKQRSIAGRPAPVAIRPSPRKPGS